MFNISANKLTFAWLVESQATQRALFLSTSIIEYWDNNELSPVAFEGWADNSITFLSHRK